MTSASTRGLPQLGHPGGHRNRGPGHRRSQLHRAARRAPRARLPILLYDFGTGFSSIEHVLRLPISGIKLDRAVTQAPGTRVGSAVTRALVGLATDLDLTTVIEGIETPAPADTARALGCTHAQGFLWSAAVPATKVPDHLTAIPAGAALY